MLPTSKTSKSVKRSRRSHHRLVATSFSACPQCGTAKLPHRACLNCGYLNSKISVKVDTEES